MPELISLHTRDAPAAIPAEGRGRGLFSRPGRWLLGGAVLALLLAGGLLWARHGGAVFTAIMLSAIAWCM